MEKIKAYLTYWHGDTANSTYAIHGYVFAHPKIPDGTQITLHNPTIHQTSNFNGLPIHWTHLHGGIAETHDTRYYLGPTNYFGVQELILKDRTHF